MIVSEKFPYGAGWINTLTCGTGTTPIVMVHGADRKLQNAGHWRGFLTDTLPGKKFFALDLPGHGDSEPGELSPVAPTFEDKVRTVVHFVRNVCDSEKVILVGRSLGGRIVLSAAAADPIVCKSVAAFVLIAPAVDEKFVFALPQSVLLKKTLLFWADDDPIVPVTNSKFLLSEMEDCRFKSFGKVLEKKGIPPEQKWRAHTPELEYPQFFKDEFTAFINSLQL